MNKYIKCFSKETADELKDIGYELLYEQNGTWFFENNEQLNHISKFSKNDVMTCNRLNF